MKYDVILIIIWFFDMVLHYKCPVVGVYAILTWQGVSFELKNDFEVVTERGSGVREHLHTWFHSECLIESFEITNMQQEPFKYHSGLLISFIDAYFNK